MFHEKRMIQELKSRIKFEKLISKVCARFINVSLEKIDCEINQSLKEVADFVGVEISYIFQLQGCGRNFKQTHKFGCNQSDHEQNEASFDMAEYPWWYQQICKKDYIYINSIDNLPEEAFKEKALFESTGYKTIVNIPLTRANHLTGFIGFVSLKKRQKFSTETLDLLRIFCEIILSSLERKEAEEAKRLLKERFEKAFNACPEGMAIISVDEGIFIDVNTSLVNIIDLDKNLIVGHKLSELGITILTQVAHLEKFISAGDKLRNLEIKVRTRDGLVRTGNLSAEPMILDGKECYLTVIKDLTDAVKIKDEMCRLERLNLVSMLAAGVSHEIRNPMTTVRGFLQMLGAKEENLGSREFFEIMIEELDRANTIISEFLTLGRNNAPTANDINDVKKTHLNLVIQTLYPLLYADAMNTGKNIILDLRDIREITVDSNDIRQLILNLVRNGLEAMAVGGKVTILTYRMKNKTILEIKDEGQGIPPEVMKQIGTPFFTTKEKGTGLGLAVCYSIAAKYDAQITVESSQEGTSFKVIFKSEENLSSMKRVINL